MKTTLPVLIFLFFLSPALQAQFVTKLQLTGGGTGSDVVEQISAVVNGHIFTGATSNSDKSHTKSENSKGRNDYWVTKFSINTNGKLSKAWDRTIGGSWDDNLETVFATEDGGCLLAGNSSSGISGDKTDTASRFGFDTWLVKLDKNGNIQWQKTIYSTNYFMKFHDIDGIPGGGFIMASGAGLTKLDSTGNILWVQPAQPEHAYISVKHTSDAGFIMADNAVAGLGLTKADGNGIPEWYQPCAPHESVIANDKAVQTSDGNYFLYGITVEEDYDGEVYYYAEHRHVVKVDTSGKSMWGIDDYDFDGYNFTAGLAETNDGGVLFGSSILDYPNPFIYNIEKINKNGVKLWQANVPGISADFLTCIVRVASNSYLLGGYTFNNNLEYPLSDLYVAGITDTTGKNGIVSKSIAAAKHVADFTVYPNPVKDKINIQSGTNATYIIQDASGKTVLSQKINGNGSIDVSRLHPGIYYLMHVETGNSYKVFKN